MKVKPHFCFVTLLEDTINIFLKGPPNQHRYLASYILQKDLKEIKTGATATSTTKIVLFLSFPYSLLLN